MRILTHIAMRWCEVRSERARVCSLRAHARYLRLKRRAEIFFRKLEGMSDDR